MSNATDTTKLTTTNGNGKAIDRPPSAIELLKRGFEQWTPALRAVLPAHIKVDRVIKIAMNVYMNKPELHKCTPMSMVKATMQCAELGLEPSPLLAECAFIPFDNSKEVIEGNVKKKVKVAEVQLMPMYVGLIKLAKQTDEVADVYAVVVDESERYPEFDESGKFIGGFYVEQGTVREIHHIQKIEGRVGKLFAVYGVVKFKDGTKHFEVLSKGDVDAVRSRSRSADSGPWETDYDEMAKKTAIKRALKTVPKSPNKPRLSQAIASDNAAEVGEAFTTEMAAAIDAEGSEVQPAAQLPQSRTDALAAKLSGTPAHDPVTGELK